MSSQTRQQHPLGQVITVGRHQRNLPVVDKIATVLAARVERNAKAAETVQKLQQERDDLTRRLERQRVDHNISDAAVQRIRDLGLSKSEARRLAHVLNAKFARHCDQKGLPPKEFDAYAAMSGFLARIGKALPIKDGNPLAGSPLPPARQEGAILPHDKAADLASRSAYQERSARHREKEIKDKEDFDRRCRALGLENPTLGSVQGDARGGLGR
jgi:hypothetical protein